jgi:hypothetical protein
MNRAGDALSIKRSRRRTGSTCVCGSPSKIPYSGFSPVRLQTGIPPRPSPWLGRLSARPAYPAPARIYTWLKPQSQRRAFPSLPGLPYPDLRPSGTPLLLRDPPVQRPLARQRVMLSLRVTAYYGLMRDSRFPSPIYVLDDEAPPDVLDWVGTERFPNLLRLSVSSVPPSVPRQTERLHSAVASSPTAAFPVLATGRRLHCHANRFSRDLRNEAAKFALCYGPVDWLALHRPGPLRSSFHLLSHLKQMSNITTRVNSQFPRPDLHRLDRQHYGLQAKNAKTAKSRSFHAELFEIGCASLGLTMGWNVILLRDSHPERDQKPFAQLGRNGN